MKSKLSIGLLAGIAAGTLVVAGCGDDTAADGTGGAGAEGGAGGNTTTTTTGGTGGMGAMGGMGGTGGSDGNDTFETAEELTLGPDAAMGQLSPIGEDVDFYKFTVDAVDGAIFAVSISAKPDPADGDAFDPSYADSVVTLYDENQNKIAENDDPFVFRSTNDSLLYTMLPAPGTYYIRVTDCIAWENGGTRNCSPAEDITNTNYTLSAGFFDPAGVGIVPDLEGGNDLVNPNLMEYEPDDTVVGEYNASLAYGKFADNADIDVFEFTVPANLAVDNSATATFLMWGPEGPDGMGTTNNAAEIWIETLNGTQISNIDASLGAESARDIRTPVTPGQTYYIFVNHPGTAAGANDFYIMSHIVGDSSPLEALPDLNDLPAMGQALPVTPNPNNAGLSSAFIEGNLPLTDLADHYKINVPGNFDYANDSVSIACGAQRSGSNIRQMTATVLASDGTTIMASDPETDTEDLFLTDVSVPDGELQLIVAIEAGAPNDGTIQNNFYQCGFHFVTAP